VPATAYFPLSLTFEKHTIDPRWGEHSLYGLQLRFSEQTPPFHLRSVHLPPSILAAFEAGKVAGFVASALEVNSPARRALGTGPDHLVACARLKDGSLLQEEPPVLRRTRFQLWGQVVLAASSAAGLLSTAEGPLLAWAGALALVAAAHFLRDVLRMPGTSFKVYSTVLPKAPA